MLPPVLLEIAVLAIGIFMVLFEAFATSEKERSLLPWIGISGLGAVLLLSFFTHSSSDPAMMAYAQFYRADALAFFFKRFALLTVASGTTTSLSGRRPIVRAGRSSGMTSPT